MFNLQIAMRSDAFFNEAGEYDPVPEVADLLTQTIARLNDGERRGHLLDINGNSIGTFELEEDR